MTRFYQQVGPVVAAVALTSLLLFSLTENTHATIIGAQSTGDQLAGGRIQVFFLMSPPKYATIVAGGPEHGTATSPGYFTFNVTGDTFLADWTLKNDTTFDEIRLVTFDLAGTMSQDPNGNIHSPGVLFDNNDPLSTPDSFAGRKGAAYVSGPVIVNSFELDPWDDDMNLGDEFVAEHIQYEGFGPLMVSVWRDDTDIVGVPTNRELPEPTTASLALAALCLVVGRRRTVQPSAALVTRCAAVGPVYSRPCRPSA